MEFVNCGRSGREVVAWQKLKIQISVCITSLL